ncbi:MAG: beta-N-acetylhexosaminidase, partial [Pseudomonadota bacterium]|nr:beta-N-acetylhexosaminidase [Pseudomonadota bacterium]
MTNKARKPNRCRALRVPSSAFTAACLAALAACGEGENERAALQVIPAPASVETRQGSFRIADGTRVHASDAASLAIARYLIDVVVRTRGIALELSESSDESGGIRLRLAPGNVESPESYALDVSAEGVEIRASGARGLFYGAVTLWQLLTADAAESGPSGIPAVHIADTPRFAWRGLMLDSARHYQ